VKLSNLGYERTLVDGIIEKVHDRRLDDGIEYAYRHFKERIESGPIIGTDEKQRREYQEVLNLCKTFVGSVDSIRSK